MYANTQKRVRTVEHREWVVSVPEGEGINHTEFLIVYGWARQHVVDTSGGDTQRTVYDDEIKIRGQEDGSVVIYVETEKTTEDPRG